MTCPGTLLAQIEREARVWAHHWHAPVLNGMVLPWLLLAALGLGVGAAVDAHSGGVAGVRYLVYVTPGVMAGAVVRTAAGSAMWPVLGGMRWTGSYHAAATTPLEPGGVYSGVLAWIGVRATVIAAAFLGVAALLGAVPSPWGVLAVPAAVAGALAVAAPLTAFAATQRSDESFELVERLGVMPMFLLSGTFFPLDRLPSVVRALAWVTPLSHAVALCRAATTASPGITTAAVHAAVLVAWTVVGVVSGRRTFTRNLYR